MGPSTRIEVVTEGILLRRMQHDPELQGVGAVGWCTAVRACVLWPVLQPFAVTACVVGRVARMIVVIDVEARGRQAVGAHTTHATCFPASGHHSSYHSQIAWPTQSG